MSKENQFVEACKNNDMITIKKLVCEGVNIHADNELGFRRACMNGHIKVVRYLTKLYEHIFENGMKYNMIDIHVDNNYSFRWACYNGHLKIILYLIKLYKRHKCYKPINIYDESYSGGNCMMYNYPVKLIANLGNYKEKLINLFI